MALLRSALLRKLKIKRSTTPFKNTLNLFKWDGRSFFSGLAWARPGPEPRPGPGLLPGRGGPGPGKKNPEAPHVCRVVWRGEAPHPSLLSADAGTVGNCVPKLYARPMGVLILGEVAATSSPKHLLCHLPRPLFANSLELSFA